jgi:hypothetical protein
MNGLRNSLATRIFVAIAATAVLIVAIMALLVALSMRDGFARYLLRGELARFSDLEQALAMANDPDAPGWPDLTANPKSWNDFVRMHFTPSGAEGFARPWPPPGPPPGRPGGPPPVPPPAGDDLMIGDRLTAAALTLPQIAAAHPDLAEFTATAFAEQPATVDCTLADGFAATCYEITVNYLPEGLEIGPFCPSTLTDEGGIWNWTGENAKLYRVGEGFLRCWTIWAIASSTMTGRST